MGFFSDILDTFLAPINYTFNFASDVFSGKNVFSSAGVLIAKDNANSSFGLENIVIKNTGADSVLNNSTVKTLTLDVSSDHAGFADYQNKLNIQGQDPTFSEVRNYNEILGKNAALAFGGYVAGGLAAGGGLSSGYAEVGGLKGIALYTGAASGAVGAVKGAASGNPGAALQGLAGAVGASGLTPDLSGFSDLTGAASQIAGDVGAIQGAVGQSQNASANAAKLVSQVKSNIPPQVSGSPITSGNLLTPATLVPVLGVGLLALLLLKGKS